jgi:protein SCO1
MHKATAGLGGWTVVRIVAILLGSLAGATIGCRTAALPVLGAVPDFELVERSERVVRAQDLDGTVWIANFIFTRCPDICPTLSRHMADVQRTLAARGAADVRLVSIAVDPAHDTPAALREYATGLAAGEQWWFLTGTRAALATLLREGFRVAWGDDGPESAPITHTDRFVLVDRQRLIRGYYHGLTAADLDPLLTDALRVRAEQPR